MIDSLLQLDDLHGWWRSDVGLFDAVSDGNNITGVAGSEVARWEDQSGNEEHLISANASQRPEVTKDGALYYGVGETVADTSVDIDVPFSIRNFTIVCLAKFPTLKDKNGETSGGLFFGHTGDVSLSILSLKTNGTLSSYDGSGHNTTLKLRSDYVLIKIVSKPEGYYFYVGAEKQFSASSVTGNIEGFRLTAGGNTSPTIQVKEVALFGRDLDNSELREVDDYLVKKGANHRPLGVLALHGDEISLKRDSWFENLDMPREPESYKLVKSDIKLDSDFLSDAVDRVDVLHNPDTCRNVAVLFAGGYNLDDGETGEEVYALIKQWGRLRKMAGFKVVVFTLPPRGEDTDVEAERVVLNGLLSADFSGVTNNANVIDAVDGNVYADVLIDLASIENVGLSGNQDNTTYYESDKTNLTAAGHALIAEPAKYAIHRLLSRRNPAKTLCNEVVALLKTSSFYMPINVIQSLVTISDSVLKELRVNDTPTVLVSAGDIEMDRGRGLITDHPDVVITVLSKLSSKDVSTNPRTDDLFDLCNEIKMCLLEEGLPTSGDTATTVRFNATYGPEILNETGVFCSQLVGTYRSYSQELLR